ncbi:winged helix-turn-helix domain-containing protein [Rouxiella sp. Mn2063]|uniref:winged helix-turn-helix domain-containing protein n=1 Tax=Rouxiella sp. Mn2063 TaxID=3395262 RepID=UPI003BCED8C6
MKYIINFTVVFDSKNRTLALANEKQTEIELTKPATRVFNELIKSNGDNLPRDVILKKAWEDLGYPASNPSLNNCISELRKSFELLGLDKKLIVTIPRIGFKIEANIQSYPIIVHNDVEESETTNDIMLSEDSHLVEIGSKSISLITSINKPKKIIKKIKIVYFLLSISILTIIYLLFNRGQSSLPKESAPQLIGIYKNCTIYTLHRMPATPNLMSKATKMLESENVDCNQGKQDIFYYEEKISNEPMKVTFFASCKKTETGDNKFCIKYKTIE